MNEEGREAPIWPELMARLAELPPDQAERILAGVEPAPQQPCRNPETGAAPAPKFASWVDFLARTAAGQRRRWAAAKARTANRERLMSGRPANRITADDVWAVMQAARGRCRHCGSQAVETRPSMPNGAPCIVGQRRPAHRIPGPPGQQFSRRPERPGQLGVVLPVVQHVAFRTPAQCRGPRRHFPEQD